MEMIDIRECLEQIDCNELIFDRSTSQLRMGYSCENDLRFAFKCSNDKLDCEEVEEIIWEKLPNADSVEVEIYQDEDEDKEYGYIYFVASVILYNIDL